MIEIEAEVVVFDLDDTLYLEKDFAGSGFRALSQHFGDRIGGNRFAAVCEDLLAKGTRGNIFDLALSHCRVDASPELIDEMVSYYRSHTPKIEFCADTSRFFNRMGAVPTGLITDGPKEAQWAKIRALELDQMLDHIVVTGEWSKGYSKPHPRAFKLIEERTSSSKHNVVYIADNAAKDFVAPRQLGWQCVQILRPGRIHPGLANSPDHEAQHTIQSFDELEIKLRG